MASAAGGKAAAAKAAALKKAKPLMTKLALKTVGTAPINWYPGHMAVAMRDIHKRLKAVDLVLEIRDARIPLSSANNDLRELITRKKHMIIMNKMDLAGAHSVQKWKTYFENRGEQPVYVNAHGRHSVNSVSCLTFTLDQTRKTLLQMIDKVKDRLNSAIAKEPTLLVMVAGFPNVGKSVLTNAIYQAAVQGKPKKAEVGPLPGVTRHISGFKIAQSPSIYLLDTPGVMIPKIRDIETGLKLALTGAIKDSVIGEDRLARYLLALLALRFPFFERKWKARAKAGTRLWEDKGCSEQEQAVRETIATSILDFGQLDEEDALCALVDEQMYRLRKVFAVPITDAEEGDNKVARKLLQLYRGGKLGSYVWDTLPDGDS